MNNFTIDKPAKSENLYSYSILRLYKQNMMLKHMEKNPMNLKKHRNRFVIR